MGISEFHRGDVGDVIGWLCHCMSSVEGTPDFPDMIDFSVRLITGDPLVLTLGYHHGGEGDQWIFYSTSRPNSIVDWQEVLAHNMLRTDLRYQSTSDVGHAMDAPTILAEVAIALWNAADAVHAGDGWKFQLKGLEWEHTDNGWEIVNTIIHFYYLIDAGDPPSEEFGLAHQTKYPTYPVITITSVQWLSTASVLKVYYADAANWSAIAMWVLNQPPIDRMMILNAALEATYPPLKAIWRGLKQRVQIEPPPGVVIPESDGTIDREVDRMMRLLQRQALTTTTVYDEAGSIDIANASVRSAKKGKQ